MGVVGLHGRTFSSPQIFATSDPSEWWMRALVTLLLKNRAKIEPKTVMEGDVKGSPRIAVIANIPSGLLEACSFEGDSSRTNEKWCWRKELVTLTIPLTWMETVLE